MAEGCCCPAARDARCPEAATRGAESRAAPGTHRHVDGSESRERRVLGRESLPAGETGVAVGMGQEGWHCGVSLPPPRHVPGGEDGVLVRARADVLGDVGVGIAGGAQQRVVGLADGQEEGCVVAGGQLDNVRHQGRGTEPKHVDAWERQEQDGRSPPVPRRAPRAHPAPGPPQALGRAQGVSGVWVGAVHSCYRIRGAPASPPAPRPLGPAPTVGRAPARAAAQRTHKPYGPAQEGVEVAAAGVNAALGAGAALQPGLQAVHDALPDHDLGRNRQLRGCPPVGIGGSGLVAGGTLQLQGTARLPAPVPWC